MPWNAHQRFDEIELELVALNLVDADGVDANGKSEGALGAARRP
jgi:hypothetical protein